MKRAILTLAAFAALLLAPCYSLRADSIKLRAVEFRTVAVAYAAPDGKTASFDLRYTDLIRQVLLEPARGGASADDVVKTVEVWAPIKRAIEAKEPRVLLNDADYQFLLNKLNVFPWAPVPEGAEAVAEFISYIRGIKEAEFEAKPKA